MDGIGKVDRNGKKYTMQISIVCTNIVASKALQNELIFPPILVHHCVLDEVHTICSTAVIIRRLDSNIVQRAE